jgi:hypothetical protein
VIADHAAADDRRAQPGGSGRMACQKPSRGAHSA